MRKIGISIYPEKSKKSDVLAYLDLAANYGFSRIFTCLLSVKGNKEEIVEEFKEINLYAKNLGFEVIVDVSPGVFNELGISYKDLSFFKEIGADGLRLDVGFSGNEESMMTFNEHGLLIEINMSNDTHYIDTIMDYMPNRYNLIGCHNFYPHNYFGLNFDYFMKCTSNFKKYGLRTAAFITSQEKDAFGPWPTSDKIATLEMHRNLSIETQLSHYIALDLIDDIIISNSYASKEEFERIAKVDLYKTTLKVKLANNITSLDKKIVLEEAHFNRGDYSGSVIRSTQSRVKYRAEKFENYNNEDIKKGDIIIESSDYGHYAGEMQIALIDMKNSGRSNVVGRVVDEQLFILDYIKPWQKFKLVEED